MTNSRRYVPALDGLRALAVLAVMAFHLSADLVPGGYLGVSVFFVLSGYLISAVLLGERDRTGRVDLRAFYVRRTLRLFPALLVGIVLALVCAQFVPAGEAPALVAGSVYALTYVTDFALLLGARVGLIGHTWSLAIEEQFYLVWPVVLLALARRRRVGRGAVVGAGAAAVITAVLFPLIGTREYFAPWTHTSELLVGVGLTAAVRGGFVPSAVVRWGWLGLVPLALGMLAVDSTDAFLYYGGWLLFALCSAAVLAHAISGTGAVVRLLSSAPAVWIGRRSYGMYLFSAPISYVALASDLSVSVRAVVTLAVTLVVAAVSFELVERPALRLKARFERGAVITG